MLARVFRALLLALLTLGVQRYALATSIVVGIIGPDTGCHPQTWADIRAGINTAVDDINSHGGIDGNKIDPIPYDDQCRRDVAVSKATRLSEYDKAILAIGHYYADTTEAARPVYEKFDVIRWVITENSTPQSITTEKVKANVTAANSGACTSAKYVAERYSDKPIVALRYKDRPASPAIDEFVRIAKTKKLAVDVREIRLGAAIIPEIMNLNLPSGSIVYFEGQISDDDLKTIAVNALFNRSNNRPKYHLITSGLSNNTEVSGVSGAVREQFQRHSVRVTPGALLGYSVMIAVKGALQGKSPSAENLRLGLFGHSFETPIGPILIDKDGMAHGVPRYISDVDTGDIQRSVNQKTTEDCH